MTAESLQDNPPNPLLDFSGLPRFDVLAATDVQPAISELLGRQRALIERLTSNGVAALCGYHLFSRFQGGSFQQVPEDAFLGALAALVDTARHDPGRLDRTTTAPYRSENSILTT